MASNTNYSLEAIKIAKKKLKGIDNLPIHDEIFDPKKAYGGINLSPALRKQRKEILKFDIKKIRQRILQPNMPIRIKYKLS